jgi:beta-xylosidase
MSSTPFGPFKDALGHPLIDRGEGYFDPTVVVDNDGQAYLYWGNPDLWYVKFNRDMISSSGPIIKTLRLTDYQEGPWFYKRRGHYYVAFASTCCPEGIGYAMSGHATGPWHYEGAIMANDPPAIIRASSTIRGDPTSWASTIGSILRKGPSIASGDR